MGVGAEVAVGAGLEGVEVVDYFFDEVYGLEGLVSFAGRKRWKGEL